MKKLFVMFVVIAILVSASAALAEGTRIAAETFPLYSLAKAIVGEDEHFEVVMDDADAQILFCVHQKEAPEGTKVVSIEESIGLAEADTDALTIPVNCMLMASYLADALAEVEPEHSEMFQENLVALVETFSDLDIAIRDAINEDTVVTCDDGSMECFAAEYGVSIADDGIVLSTYNNPAEDLNEFTYLDLMRLNLEKLKGE